MRLVRAAGRAASSRRSTLEVAVYSAHAGCNLGCSSPPFRLVQPSPRLMADLRPERS